MPRRKTSKPGDGRRFNRPISNLPDVPLNKGKTRLATVTDVRDLPKKRSRGDSYTRMSTEQVDGKLIGQKLLDGDYSQHEVAEMFGVTQTTIYLSLASFREDQLQERAIEEFEEEGKWRQWDLHIDLYSLSDDELELLAGYFGEWREQHFRDSRGNAYTLPAHQKRWTFLIFRAIRDGGKLLILSPPRHGKTDLLIHIDLFLITRVNPNIRLVKVCKSEGLAKKAVGAVKDMLENSKALKEECLPKGQEFKPPYASGRPWTALEMTVATRDVMGMKSPTLAAVGSGGTLLSRDGDMFTLDDIEDHQTTLTEDQRQKTRDWFANDFESRKEDWTGQIGIGSRQHPDDLWGHIAENPEWDVVIERAHDDENCEIEDPDNPDNWDLHVDCMLWPEMRSFRWLMAKKNDPLIRPRFSMTYQNYPQDADIDMFSRELVDSVRSMDRITVDEPPYERNVPESFYDEEGIRHGIRLIAGLDPAATGYQASFVWAFDPAANFLHAVDFEDHLGGGIVPAREVVSRYFAWYGLRHWVIEDNYYHGGISSDDLLRKFCEREGIYLQSHETHMNKWDPELGVSALAWVMRDGRMSIPWGDMKSQEKWSQYRKQLIGFSRERRAKGKGRRHSDLVMASWFPYETIKKWRKEWVEAQDENETVDNYLFTPMDQVYRAAFAGVGFGGY